MKLENAIQSNKFSSQLQKAGVNILYTAWWLKTIVSKELKTLDLTHEQFNVLRILKGKHPEEMCVKDIGCRMIERNSNVPRIIDRLVIKKLVDRSNSAHDKRETVITLTEIGKNLVENATQKVDSIMKQLMSVTEEEGMQLNDLLEKLRANE